MCYRLTECSTTPDPQHSIFSTTDKVGAVWYGNNSVNKVAMSVIDFQATTVSRGPVADSRVIGTGKELDSIKYCQSTNTVAMTYTLIIELLIIDIHW